MHRLQIARPSPFARGTILLSLSSKVQELYTKYTDPFFMRVFYQREAADQGLMISI